MNYKKSKSHRKKPIINEIRKMPLNKIKSIYHNKLNSISSLNFNIIQRKTGPQISDTFSQPELSKTILPEKIDSKCNTYSKIVRVNINSNNNNSKNQQNTNIFIQDPLREKSKSLKTFKISNRSNNTDINNLEKSKNSPRKKYLTKNNNINYNTANNTGYYNIDIPTEEINIKKNFIYVNRNKKNSNFIPEKVEKKNNLHIYEGFKYDLPLQYSEQNNLNTEKNEVYNKKLVKCSSSDKRYTNKSNYLTKSIRDIKKKNNFCFSPINNDKFYTNPFKLELNSGTYNSIDANSVKFFSVSSGRETGKNIQEKVAQSKKLFEEILSKEKKIKQYFISNNININDRELYEQSAILIQSIFRGYSMRIKIYHKLNDYINIRNLAQVIKRLSSTLKFTFLQNFKELAKTMPIKDKNYDNKILSKNTQRFPIYEIKIEEKNYFSVQKTGSFDILSAKKEMNKKLILLNQLLKDKSNLQKKLDNVLNENKNLKKIQFKYEELKKKYQAIEIERKIIEDINNDYIKDNTSLNNKLNHTIEQLKQYKSHKNTNGKIDNTLLKKVYLKYLILNKKSKNQILLKIAFNKYKLIISNSDNGIKKKEKKEITIDNGYIIGKEEEESNKIRNKKLKDLIKNKIKQNKEFMHKMLSKFYYKGLLFILNTKENNYKNLDIPLQNNIRIKNGQDIPRGNVSNKEIKNKEQKINNTNKLRCLNKLLLKKDKEMKDILKCYYFKFYYNGIIFSLQNNKIYNELENNKEEIKINGIENKDTIQNIGLFDKRKIILKKIITQKNKKINIILKNFIEKWNIKTKIISMLELTRNNDGQTKIKRKKTKKKEKTSSSEDGEGKKSNKDQIKEKKTMKSK